MFSARQGWSYIAAESGNWAQVAKLIASDAEPADYFGESVSISGDGNTAIVGAYFKGTFIEGAAYIFIKSGDTWTQQAKITGEDRLGFDFFGQSVSITSDGNTVIVGAPYEDDDGSGGFGEGAAYIFTRSGTTWTQQAKITPSDLQLGALFGSVSISADGNTAIVGAGGEDTGATDAGAAYIFTRSGTTWSQQAKITASDAEADDSFGRTVSISGDGNIAIVGTNSGTGSDAGAAYIFTRSGTTWSQQAKLTASDAEADDVFGYSVSISADGNTAIVSALEEDAGGTDAGAAYIFTRSGTTWSQQAKLTASDAETYDYFGSSVSISADGNTAVVGANGEDASGILAGAAYIFTRSGTTWTQQSKIIASDAQANDSFGQSVSISGDGNTVIAGAPLEDDGAEQAGAAYIFENP